jgi:hypothetical protein
MLIIINLIYYYYYSDIKDLEIILNEQKQHIIRKVDKIIKKEIKKAKNSILYSVRRGYDEIKAKMTVRSLTGQSEADLQKELGLAKPFDTCESFVAFDIRLKDENLNMMMVLFIILYSL